MNHLDLNPISCTRGELYDAYMDMTHRGLQFEEELVLLLRRQSALEAFIAALVEGSGHETEKIVR